MSDTLAVAAEAVAAGSANSGHWDTLGAFVQRDGVDHVAQALEERDGPCGPSLAWWRCTLLLSMELSTQEAVDVARELIAIEEAGGGPAFNLTRHVRRVANVMDLLHRHMERVNVGRATRSEIDDVEAVILKMRILDLELRNDAVGRGRSGT